MARNLSVVLLSTFSDEGLKKAQKSLEGLGKKMNSLGNNALKLGASFAAFQGTRALVDFASGAIEQSRDLERNMNGLAAVFGEMTPTMVEFSENAYKMGLSQSEAAKSVTFIGSVLKQSGFAIAETSELTKKLITLGTDLSITYGYDVQEALLGMTALFRGEYDPIEKFGVAMKQSEIDAVKAARGLGQLTGAAERLADQQIRVELLFQRSADAQGMFQKSSEGLFAAQQVLEASFKNMQATAGNVLTPAFASLTLAMIPLVEKLTPVLAQMMNRLVPVIIAVANNTDALEKAINEFANGVVLTITVLRNIAVMVIENITLFKNLALAIAAVTIAGKLIQGLTFSMQLLTVAVSAATTGFKIFRSVLITTGLGAIVVGVGFLVSKFVEATDTSKDFANGLPQVNFQLSQTAEAAALAAEKVQYFKAGLSMSAAEFATRDFVFTPPEIVTPDSTSTGGATTVARDYVKEFYAGLKDEAAKQKAKIKLENLGATSGLIDSILGAGEEWQKVFDDVIKKGAKSVAAAQLLFNKTADGLAEITAQVEADNEALKEAYEDQVKIFEDAVDAFEAFEKAANEAGDSFGQFLSEMSTLATFESAMGKFESAVVSDLASIEEKLDDAFDNGYLLDESFRNLQNYARSEYVALQAIARQRDNLLERRNLADALLKDVKNATIAAGNITSILQDTQTETNKINMTKVVQDTVQAGKNMKDFRVTIISDFVEPIEEAASKSELLVSGFRAVVDRTRLFVDNLKALRQLGLDPLLFNQLVEAGVEAGGETAQALIDGGADTITEVNSLFGELDALGQELGENTAQVMYGEGQEFVNGIIAGLDSMLDDLESTATVLANTFVDTFSSILAAGIARAVAAAQAAVPAAPAAPVYKKVEEVVQETKEALEEIAGVAEKTTTQVAKAVEKTTTEVKKVVASTTPKAQPISTAKVLFQSPTNAQMSAIQQDKKATSAMFKTADQAFYGATSGQGRTTINLTVNASSRTQGAQAGQQIVKEISKFTSVSGGTGLIAR